MRHSQFVYQASAYGLAAQFDRPVKHSISTQASTALAASGGRGYDRVSNFKFDGFVSFDEAYVEVGGSYDDENNIHTLYSSSVIEGLNVGDVLTADRVVSRMFVYAPADEDEKGETSWDITGSHFDNLRIAGHKVEVKLATQVFHDHDTYGKVAKAHQSAKSDDWLLGSKLDKLDGGALKDLENNYSALRGMSRLVSECKTKEGRPEDRGSYCFSPANGLDLKEQIGDTELQGFGSIICIPKFGVIRLAELVVHPHSRHLTMFRVQMCSSSSGSTDGGTANGGGTKPLPPPR
jgi:hypothetical protein